MPSTSSGTLVSDRKMVTKKEQLRSKHVIADSKKADSRVPPPRAAGSGVTSNVTGQPLIARPPDGVRPERKQDDSQPSLNPASHVYYDRFGVPHASESPTTPSLLSANTASQGTDHSLPDNEIKDSRMFKAYGIEAYPTRAYKDEICLAFVHSGLWCHYGTQCHRIHPRNKSLYLRNFLDLGRQLTSRDIATDQTGASASTPRGQRTTMVQDVESPGPPTENGKLSRSKSHELAVSQSTASFGSPFLNIKASPPATSRQPGWDPDTGWWDPRFDNSEWNDSESSGDGAHETILANSVYPSSSRSSVTDEDSVADRDVSSNSRLIGKPEACRNWRLGRCHLGSRCRYLHPKKFPMEPSTHTAAVSSPGSYREKDRSVDAHHGTSESSRSVAHLSPGSNSSPESSAQKVMDQSSSSRNTVSQLVDISNHHINEGPQIPMLCRVGDERRTDGEIGERHPPQRYNEVCKRWLRNQCWRGDTCCYAHRKLDDTHLASPAESSRPMVGPLPQSNIPIPPPTPSDIFSTTIHDHIRIKFADGFDVFQVVTGFETSWLFIGNIPKRVKESDITTLLKEHGELLDLRMPAKSHSPLMIVKARFASASEASKACTTLNGLQAFDPAISARLSLVNANSSSTLLNDTAVRIRWEAPSKVGYGGYPTMEQASKAISIARTTPYNNHLVRASIHSGMPAVGAVTVLFQGLPVDADAKGMKQFAEPEDVMWGQPNYTSHHRAVNGIKRMLADDSTDVLEFQVLPPIYKNGMVVAWAHFSTPGEAKVVCDRIHNRKPGFTGNTRIFAQHMKSIQYSLTPDKYRHVAADIEALASSAWRLGNGSSVTTVQRATFVSVKLCGEDLKELSHLKSELDIILSGETIRHEGKVVWDYFFCSQAGTEFLKDMERSHAPITILVDLAKRNLRLSGSARQRTAVRKKIVDKVSLLMQQNLHVLPLDGHLIGLFMSDELIQLQQDLGPENVILNLWDHHIKIRGDEHSYNAAKDAVNRARRKRSVHRRPSGVDCPVCFDEVSSPVTLSCGHSWCRTCIIRYLTTAVEQKFFPLTCLGNEAKCQKRIPLSCARSLLPAADFEAVVEAAFEAHIHKHPEEFHFCPTPDCQQVYRAAPRVSRSTASVSSGTSDAVSSSSTQEVGTILQCPSCLARICASCQSEAHDGLGCAEADGGEGFKEWMKEHDVKACPGCKMPIERAEGCHHVTCTMCHTHLCWVCLETFPNGEGIYGHMRAMHGSFGLGPIE